MALRRALALAATTVMLVVVGAFAQAAPAVAHHSSGGGGGYPHHYQRIGGQQRTAITFVDHTPARWKVRASVVAVEANSPGARPVARVTASASAVTSGASASSS